ncbi:L,D-transpeptidase family protein [Synechococcales cyanobacterium C]|uniref:L,D-transpeptidase family protein n=2 Tax=Petrachloros TaxID=2918834 RepID=A0A8K2A9A0_9CYAN|nr:L,D-transpeptidase family protein [Petrachloros mirabilis ULC683]
MVARPFCLSSRLLGTTVALGLWLSPQVVFASTLAVAPFPGLPDASLLLPEVIIPKRLELDLRNRRVTLWEGRKAVKTYPVAIGRQGWETPVGEFKVKTMYKDPPWANPFTGDVISGGDPENPLGRRWIGFWSDGNNWIGFHGTPNRGSVGQAASHGCVRMLDEHIAELYEKVAIGVPVIVTR